MLQNSRNSVSSRMSLTKMKIACLPQVGQQNTRKAAEVYANCKHITGSRSRPYLKDYGNRHNARLARGDSISRCTDVNVSQNIVHPVNNKEGQFYNKRNIMCFSNNLELLGTP